MSEARCAKCNALLGLFCEEPECPRTQLLTAIRTTENQSSPAPVSSASEASRLLTERDAEMPPWRASYFWMRGQRDKAVAALVARDAELAEHVDSIARLARAFESAEAEVTQLRAERGKLQGRVYALETSLPENFLEALDAAERLAHDRGEALTDLLADVDGARWQIENYLGTTMEAGPLGCFNNLARSAARARKLLAGVVPPEQAPRKADSGGDKVASSGGGA